MKVNVWTITDRKNTEAEAREHIASIDTWNIDDIHSITETEAQIMAESHEVIKGHDIYFIDFGGYFKYSCIVFLHGHNLRYAGDYELHHSNRTREELHKWYVNALEHKLFTEEQLKGQLTDYDEYTARRDYLHNYFGDSENHVSVFGDGTNKDYVAEFKRVTATLVCNPVTFAYYESAAFVEKCKQLEQDIEAAKEVMTGDIEYWKKAFYYEFANHECIYSGEYESAAYVATNGKELNDIQKKAYIAALEKYEREVIA